MTKEERRAEKIRMLVQSGSLFAEAAQTLADTKGVPREAALQCVFVAEVTRALSGIQDDLKRIEQALEERK